MLNYSTSQGVDFSILGALLKPLLLIWAGCMAWPRRKFSKNFFLCFTYISSCNIRQNFTFSMGVQMSVVPPFPGEYFEPQGSTFCRKSLRASGAFFLTWPLSARYRFPPPSPLRNYNGRNAPESGGGVRRRAKSPPSMPSSCENSSPQQNREAGGDRGRERRVRECRENRDEQKSSPKESSEESRKYSVL